MRNLPAALAISVIAHGAVLGWWVTRRHPTTSPAARVERPPVDVEIVTLPPTPPPATITFAPEPDDHAPAIAGTPPIETATAIAPRVDQRHPPESAAHAEPAPSATEPAPPAHPPDTSGGTLLSMRDPSRRKVDVDGALEVIAAKPQREHPETPEPSGVRTIDDIDNDIAETERELHDPSWVENATPEAVGEARRRLEALRAEHQGHELQRNRDGSYTAAHQGYTVTVNPDGTTHVSDQRNWQQHGLNATFDATDALMRHYGQDPYAANKLHTLDRTRDERAEIARRYKHEQLRHSKELVVAALDAVWRKTSNLGERKRLVFELWDDCAETGDADVVQGGRDARTAVVTFIQAHFTGADAYTAAELHDLNAHRASREPFAPYEHP